MYGKLQKLMTKIEMVTCNFKFQPKLQNSMRVNEIVFTIESSKVDCNFK